MGATYKGKKIETAKAQAIIQYVLDTLSEVESRVNAGFGDETEQRKIYALRDAGLVLLGEINEGIEHGIDDWLIRAKLGIQNAKLDSAFISPKYKQPGSPSYQQSLIDGIDQKVEQTLNEPVASNVSEVSDEALLAIDNLFDNHASIEMDVRENVIKFLKSGYEVYSIPEFKSIQEEKDLLTMVVRTNQAIRNSKLDQQTKDGLQKSLRSSVDFVVAYQERVRSEVLAIAGALIMNGSITDEESTGIALERNIPAMIAKTTRAIQNSATLSKAEKLEMLQSLKDRVAKVQPTPNVVLPQAKTPEKGMMGMLHHAGRVLKEVGKMLGKPFSIVHWIRNPQKLADEMIKGIISQQVELANMRARKPNQAMPSITAAPITVSPPNVPARQGELLALRDKNDEYAREMQKLREENLRLQADLRKSRTDAARMSSQSGIDRTIPPARPSRHEASEQVQRQSKIESASSTRKSVVQPTELPSLQSRDSKVPPPPPPMPPGGIPVKKYRDQQALSKPSDSNHPMSKLHSKDGLATTVNREGSIQRSDKGQVNPEELAAAVRRAGERKQMNPEISELRQVIMAHKHAVAKAPITPFLKRKDQSESMDVEKVAQIHARAIAMKLSSAELASEIASMNRDFSRIKNPSENDRKAHAQFIQVLQDVNSKLESNPEALKEQVHKDKQYLERYKAEDDPRVKKALIAVEDTERTLSRSGPYHS